MLSPLLLSLIMYFGQRNDFVFEHFLRTQSQRNIGGACTQALDLEIEGGTTGGADILDIVDRNTLAPDHDTNLQIDSAVCSLVVA